MGLFYGCVVELYFGLLLFIQNILEVCFAGV
jgi:hypothetical protein